jgi:hypothetical protein
MKIQQAPQSQRQAFGSAEDRYYTDVWGVECAGCGHFVSYTDSIYGKVITEHFEYGSVECKDGSTKSAKWPVTYTGRWCVSCTRLPKTTFELKEEHK